MIMNELLIEKYQTQKTLDDIANHDLAKYISNSHSKIKEISDNLKLKLKYGVPSEIQIKKDKFK